jgi:hypothetical protein
MGLKDTLAFYEIIRPRKQVKPTFSATRTSGRFGKTPAESIS